MFQRNLLKPDGRALRLYSRMPIDPQLEATSPTGEAVPRDTAHLRWHPLRAEWVAYAAHRQDRTFLPPKAFNPLAPSGPGSPPTELPLGAYDVAVFDNMFPTLSMPAAPPPALDGVDTMPASGACEVVVFAQDPSATLGTLPVSHLDLLLEVWAERYQALGALPQIHYVMSFENRGVEVGVTLHHPHGQTYAYPFVPPVPARELEQQARYSLATGRSLVSDLVAREVSAGTRLLYAGPHAAAFVPAFARYPYEVWLATRRAVPSLAALTAEERRDLAVGLKTVVLKYDGLWQRPFPYLMTVHQAPTDGREHPGAHAYFEFSPAFRSVGRLKYLAGTELGAGLFANDSFPEAKAAELQRVEVTF